jgi:ABC-type Na+ transport system ATPase subunit NatA
MYSYNRTSSDTGRVSKALSEVLRALPQFHDMATKLRQDAKTYLDAAESFSSHDQEAMKGLADEVVIGRVGEMVKHLAALEKELEVLQRINPHEDR